MLLLGLTSAAQQEAHFSQYMFNGLVLNPAYAGSRGYMSSVFMFRKQWMGFDGAPQNQSVSFHAPSINLRHGYGIFYANDQLGNIRDQSFSLAYSFRISVSETSFLSLGLRGGFWNYSVDMTDLQNPTSQLLINSGVYDPNDPAFAGNNTTLWHPNVGTGLYFSSKRAYTGLSIPQLIPTSLAWTTGMNARRYFHVLFTQGFLIPLGEHLKLRPSTLVKYAPGAPVQFDINGSVVIKELFWVGVSYRTQEGIVLITEIMPNSWIRFGYSYDITTSSIGQYNSGTHEFMLGFDLHFKGDPHVSPRYF